MEYILPVTAVEANILFQSDIEFYDDMNGEVSFDDEEEYEKARKLLGKDK